MSRKTGGRKIDSSKKTEKLFTNKNYDIKGNRQLHSPKIILLCEDTASAYYYYKYFVQQYKLNVDLEPKIRGVGSVKIDRPNGLNNIFHKAALFHERNNMQQIMMAYDTDEFYRKTNPKIRCKKAYERFVSDNSNHGKFVYLDTFPCFEYWLYLHYSQSDKYFESFESLVPELNKLLKKYKFKSLEGSVCSRYSKAASFWVKKENNEYKYLATNFPILNLKQAISYSKKHTAVIGTNSHSNIWKFFNEFKNSIPEIADAFNDKNKA